MNESAPSYTDDNVNYDWDYPIYPNYNYQPVPRHIKRTTKTIEKYGPSGEYLGKEVITTDEEDIVEQVWGNTITVSSGEGTFITGDNISGNTTHWDPENSNWSYTASNTGSVSFSEN